MARRRRRREEHENHERWLVSYADFITLLFAFFVVMYAISSVNEGKYRVLSDSLETAFGKTAHEGISTLDQPATALEPGIFTADASLIELRSARALPQFKALSSQQSADDEAEALVEKERLRKLAGDLRKATAPYIHNELIEVSRDADWVEVEMKSSLLFESGSAELSDRALPVLRQIAGTLRGIPNPIHVEGFTDNVPIDTVAYPSNWELSAARSASVVHLFDQLGVDPVRMAAIGYGEFQPVADNATAEGRNKNRRVVLVILANSRARHGVQPAPESDLLKGRLAGVGVEP